MIIRIFYGENVCVRVEMMQNSSAGRTAGYSSLPCMVPGSSPGSALVLCDIVFL